MSDTYGYGEREKESRELIKTASNVAYGVYLKREEDYSDSWRDRNIPWLLNRLMGEVDEVNYLIQSEQHGEKLYGELCDVVNVSLMLMSKIRLEDKKE